MNEIGSKIMFVGFPIEITKFKKDEHELINTFITNMKEKNIPYPDNNGWEKCKQNINDNYRGLCEFISYDDFIQRDISFNQQFDALIFFSKIYDDVEIQIDEYISTINKHCLRYMNADDNHMDIDYGSKKQHLSYNENWQHIYDTFLGEFEQYFERAYWEGETIKEKVNDKIKAIQVSNPKCKFCLIPLSGVYNEHEIAFEKPVEGSQVTCNSSKSMLPVLQPLSRVLQLRTSQLIMNALYSESCFVSRDFEYFHLSVGPKQYAEWYDSPKPSDIQYNDIFDSVHLILSNTEETELVILPHTLPDTFEKNIITMISGMGYTTEKNEIKPSKSGQPTYEILKHEFLLKLFAEVEKDKEGFGTIHFLKFYIQSDWRFEFNASNTLQKYIHPDYEGDVKTKAIELFGKKLGPTLQIIIDRTRQDKKLYKYGMSIIKEMYSELDEKVKSSIKDDETGKYFKSYGVLEIKSINFSWAERKLHSKSLNDTRKDYEKKLEELIKPPGTF